MLWPDGSITFPVGDVGARSVDDVSTVGDVGVADGSMLCPQSAMASRICPSESTAYPQSSTPSSVRPQETVNDRARGSKLVHLWPTVSNGFDTVLDSMNGVPAGECQRS